MNKPVTILALPPGDAAFVIAAPRSCRRARCTGNHILRRLVLVLHSARDVKRSRARGDCACPEAPVRPSMPMQIRPTGGPLRSRRGRRLPVHRGNLTKKVVSSVPYVILLRDPARSQVALSIDQELAVLGDGGYDPWRDSPEQRVRGNDVRIGTGGDQGLKASLVFRLASRDHRFPIHRNGNHTNATAVPLVFGVGEEKVDEVPSLGFAEARRETGHRGSRDAVANPPEQVALAAIE